MAAPARRPHRPDETEPSSRGDSGERARARQLEALNRAALAIAGDLDLERVLLTILRTAASLVGARYGALGIPDGRGGFDRFLTVGISDARARRIGELPRYHGVLGILLREGRSIRVDDIREHPSFSWYPGEHPEMAEFLGVPIRHRGRTLGELYLSGTPAGRFSARDQELVEMLASHAGVAIDTARLYAESQSLAIMEERNRVARELHDAASQTLFSMVYEARAAAIEARAGQGDPVAALERLHDQAAAALGELRGMVYALRPKSLERDGLAATLAEHAESLRRGQRVEVEFRAEGHPALSLDEELALLRIGQEALHNAVRHGRGAPVRAYLRAWRGGTELSVRDEGPGFDADALPRTVRTMGLGTMAERAAAINAAFTLDAAPGRGTEVRVFLPARPPRSKEPRPKTAGGVAARDPGDRSPDA